MRKLASWCFEHRRITVAAWVVGLVALTAMQSAAGSAYSNNFDLPHTPSFDAIRLLERNAPRASGESDQIVIAVKQGTVTDPEVRNRTEVLLGRVARLPHVSGVGSPFAPGAQRQIAPSGQVAFADVTFDAASNRNAISATAANRFVTTITSASVAGPRGLQFAVEGNIAKSGNQNSQSTGLIFGFLAAAVVLFIVFGSLTAMALPLISARCRWAPASP